MLLLEMASALIPNSTCLSGDLSTCLSGDRSTTHVIGVVGNFLDWCLGNSGLSLGSLLGYLDVNCWSLWGLESAAGRLLYLIPRVTVPRGYCTTYYTKRLLYQGATVLLTVPEAYCTKRVTVPGGLLYQMVAVLRTVPRGYCTRWSTIRMRLTNSTFTGLHRSVVCMSS